MKWLGFAMLLGGMILVSCGGSEDITLENPNVRSAERTARTAADRLTGTLLGEVQRAMKEGGAAHAVRTCSGIAMDLTRSVADEYGVTMRRVTTQPRNPLDTPDPYEQRVLARFAEMQTEGALDASTVQTDVLKYEGTPVLRFMKPLIIMKPCLACHGGPEQISPEVAAELRKAYPEDRATGYRAGDLRGAISVIVPLNGE